MQNGHFSSIGPFDENYYKGFRNLTPLAPFLPLMEVTVLQVDDFEFAFNKVIKGQCDNWKLKTIQYVCSHPFETHYL
jgi:hypothetical protein